jgi:hypothetical protein
MFFLRYSRMHPLLLEHLFHSESTTGIPHAGVKGANAALFRRGFFVVKVVTDV